MNTQSHSLAVAAMQLLIALTPRGWLPFLLAVDLAGPAIQAVFVDGNDKPQGSVAAETLEELENALLTRFRPPTQEAA
ncbi:hypothetical protein [Pseudomonas oryzihabitans]|uniref:hypothetical protein n=1 Tax=Pseudomonas oryzihabitans TaxID=47885 RepID=UPI0028943806|nr:hypothetical protein [Pseudomonas oryzihabitans]MDT3720325.1 hypothetical protein [Pseudomonas oryzihabitans]